MRKLLQYAVLCLVLAFPALAGTRIIPIAGHAPGANNTAWITDVTLKNNTSTAMNVELVFHAGDGIPRSRFVSLGAGASMLLDDAVAPSKFGAGNPGWVGQLEIRAPGDVSASAHIFTGGRDGGTFGSTYEGVDPSVLSTAGAMAGLLNNDRFRSNIAFANPNAQAVTINYALRNADGSVAATRTFHLPAHTTRQMAMGDDVGRTGDEPLSLFWSATGRAYAVGSIIDNASGDPTSAPSVSRDATSLFYPIAGRSAGANGTFWSTSASIANASGSAGSVTIAYIDAFTGRTFTRTAVLPPLGSISTADVNDFVGAPEGIGSLRVLSTTPLAAVVRVFNTLGDGSTYGAAVLPQDDLVRSTAINIDGVRRDRDYRLNVAVANSEAVAAHGRIRLFDERGVEVESQPFTAQAGKSAQIGIPGAIEVRAGELRIESENGVAITATASNINNTTGDTLQREVQQEAERQNELEIAMSTRTAAIGVPVSFSLERAGSDVTAVKWQFGDGTSASGAEVTHSYIAAGEFDVTVEVTLASGAVVRDREDIRITGSSTNPPATTAIDFTWSPAAPAPGEQVVFTATGATDGGFFKWKFPGNVRPVGNTVTFTFPNAGAFQVEVEIEHGATRAEVTRVVTVGGSSTNPNNPGVGPIDFTFSPAAPQAGEEVTFSASGNTGGGVFKWKFPGNIRKFGDVVTFTFPANGSFGVEVEVEHGTVVAEITKIVTVGGTGTGGNNPPGGGTGALDFTFSPASPEPGQEVTFTATGDTGGGVYKWKFPGDVRKLGQVVTFTFAAAGSYRVEVEVEHGTIESEVEKTVTVGGSGNGGGNPPGSGAGPLDFTFAPTAPNAGETVTFTASGDTFGGSYKWKFPGDVRKFGQTVTFTFASAGSFRVELEIEHGTVEREIEKTVTVGGSGNGGGNPPGSGAGPLDFTFAPTAPNAGETVTFTASGDTFGGSYKWKFPGDVRKFGQTVTFTFASAGTYRVELEIENGTVEREIEKTVTVTGGSGNPPGGGTALDFTFSPASPRAGEAVTFTATGDTGGGTYEWEFPNGVKRTGAVVTVTFPAAGTYEVELEVEDGSVDAKVEKRVTVSP